MSKTNNINVVEEKTIEEKYRELLAYCVEDLPLEALQRIVALATNVRDRYHK